jgi:hypothetical protein
LKPSQQAYDEAESQKNKIKAPLAWSPEIILR